MTSIAPGLESPHSLGTGSEVTLAKTARPLYPFYLDDPYFLGES